MGMYTGIRFRGYVKKEYRNKFENIALKGQWVESDIPQFKKFGQDVWRSSFIPCGALMYMPWEREEKEYKKSFNKETGLWVFQCSLKNYENEINTFFDLIPFFMETAEIEVYYEEWVSSLRYELRDGKVSITDSNYIQYEAEF